MQKFLRVDGCGTNEINVYLEDGWVVKEFQSFNNMGNKENYASYALLER